MKGWRERGEKRASSRVESESSCVRKISAAVAAGMRNNNYDDGRDVG